MEDEEEEDDDDFDDDPLVLDQLILIIDNFSVPDHIEAKNVDE